MAAANAHGHNKPANVTNVIVTTGGPQFEAIYDLSTGRLTVCELGKPNKYIWVPPTAKILEASYSATVTKPKPHCKCCGRTDNINPGKEYCRGHCKECNTCTPNWQEHVLKHTHKTCPLCMESFKDHPNKFLIHWGEKHKGV